jgi:hypothetical protein
MPDVSAESHELDLYFVGVAAALLMYRNPYPDESEFWLKRDRPACFDVQSEKQLGVAAATGPLSP